MSLAHTNVFIPNCSMAPEQITEESKASHTTLILTEMLAKESCVGKRELCLFGLRLPAQSATRQVKEVSHCRNLSLPSFSKPIAHDSNHTGPTSGLQQAVHNPETAVEPLVVEMQPLCERTKEEYLGKNK